MKNKIKILLVQNNAILADRQANFQKVNEMLFPFAESCVDLIVLPELWNAGWYCKAFPEVAEEDSTSETLAYLSDIAKKFNANIAGGSYVRKTVSGDLKNTCPVFNRNGELIAQYDKMHLYTHTGQGEGNYASRGEKPVIAQTDIGKLGLTICYDIRFPEIFRKYAFAGADLLLNMAAWPIYRKNHWITLQKARAIENQSFMIAVSQVGRISDKETNLGYSMVVNPLGEIISSLEDKEDVLECEIDLNTMYQLRKEIPTLNDVHQNYDF